MCTQTECEGVVCLTVDKALITSLYHLQPRITHIQKEHLHPLTAYRFLPCSRPLFHTNSLPSVRASCVTSATPPVLLTCELFSLHSPPTSSVSSLCVPAPLCFLCACKWAQLFTLEHSTMFCTLTPLGLIIPISLLSTLWNHECVPLILSWRTNNTFFNEYASCGFVNVPVTCTISSWSNFRDPFKKEEGRGL